MQTEKHIFYFFFWGQMKLPGSNMRKQKEKMHAHHRAMHNQSSSCALPWQRKKKFSTVTIILIRNSERALPSIMSCAVKTSFKTDLQISLQRSIILTPVSLLTKTGFHASNLRSPLSEFELCARAEPCRHFHAASKYPMCNHVGNKCYKGVDWPRG